MTVVKFAQKHKMPWIAKAVLREKPKINAVDITKFHFRLCCSTVVTNGVGSAQEKTHRRIE